MKIRPLERHEIGAVWSIDRAEVIDNIYSRVGSELVLRPLHVEMRGWPPGEPEHYGPILLDYFDHGGTCLGAFDGETLIGGMLLESRFIGRGHDQLQLEFLHVDRRHRRSGIGRTLFERAVARARELGARSLYISSTESENTVHFYLRRGARVTDDVDPALFALEPEDIHLVYEIPSLVVGGGASGRS